MTVIQSQPLTIGLESKRLIVLETLRRQRNVADYTGDDVDATTAEHCISEAGRLIDGDAVEFGELIIEEARRRRAG